MSAAVTRLSLFTPRVRTNLAEQLRGSDTKRIGECLHHPDCRIAGSTLQIADVSPMDARLIRESLLAELSFLTQTAQVSG